VPAGVLYVVATPIGNLGDLTPRAREVLATVDLVAAEDTRRTRVLLARQGIRRPMVAYYDAVERSRAGGLVERLLAGESVALVSDAGTPGVSDPGYHLVRAAAAAGVAIVPIPGASAVTALLSIAGIPCERFVFEGFLPAKAGPRGRAIERLATEPRAIVLLESARRIGTLLRTLADVLGSREAVLGRELTKQHEEILRGTLPDLATRLGGRAAPRGEIVLVIAAAAARAAEPSAEDLDAAIRRSLAAGCGVRETATRLARAHGRPRRDVYARALALANADHQSST
jgi:16S rRNA (cytidine1402-2'-O)-methyltransferase